MPITRQDVLDDIASKITDKVAAGSLTNAEDGANRELMLDYIDQEVRTKVLKRTVTHLELLDIFTTPITLLPATAGKMYVPKDILVKFIDNEGWGSTGTWRVLLDAVQLTNFISQMGSGTTFEQFAYLLQGNPSNTTTSFFNKAVTLTSSANPTVPVNPDTTVVVYLTYFEILE